MHAAQISLRAVAGVRKGLRNQDECKSLSSRRRAGGNCKRLGRAAHTGKLHSNFTPGIAARSRTSRKDLLRVGIFNAKLCERTSHTGGVAAGDGSWWKTLPLAAQH
jgi:hypothetical protein